MTNQPSVKVRIRCVVDLPVGNWSPGVMFEELKEQAKREGIEKLKRIISDHGGSVYGEPKLVFTQAVES